MFRRELPAEAIESFPELLQPIFPDAAQLVSGVVGVRYGGRCSLLSVLGLLFRRGELGARPPKKLLVSGVFPEAAQLIL
jgi:hypothetical protein